LHEGERICFVHGVFPDISVNTIVEFERYKQYCHVLIVAIYSDSFVADIVGRDVSFKPLADRLAAISYLEPVDYCLILERDTLDLLVSVINPIALVDGLGNVTMNEGQVKSIHEESENEGTSEE
jgi:bifunctional ADP-heptose synthase (sugar kinase/adenylyltransferase)